LRDLAVRGERLTDRRESLGQHLLEHRLPLRRGATTADDGLQERHNLLQITRIDEREPGPRRDVVPYARAAS
jgi:hypothetical protein